MVVYISLKTIGYEDDGADATIMLLFEEPVVGPHKHISPLRHTVKLAHFIQSLPVYATKAS